jgi:glycosyltransferase involved in cell wall biosynthesis
MTSDDASIDILLPFYGDVEYFKLAVKSVLDQTDSKWKLIISDDKNPDSSGIDWAISLNDPRIDCQRNDENLGASRNFQKCLDQVSAKYFVVFGADDLMEPTFIERMRKEISKNPSADILHGGVQVIDSFGNLRATTTDRIKNVLRPKPGSYQGDELASRLMLGNWTYFPAIVWRAETTSAFGFGIHLNVAADLGLIMEVVLTGGTLYVFDDPVFRYRRHGSNDSLNRAIDGSRFVEEKEFFKLMETKLKAKGWKSAARSASLHITSRLNATFLLPKTITNEGNTKTVLRHIFF